MSDIVEWLEHIADYDTPQDPREGCRKAALEIERLRAALLAIANTATPYYEDDAIEMVRIAREALGEDG